ncbi:uncharacterized protein OCT59_007141 [Rhizophagus irregularis]|uniref:Arrestin-like N-terminal domain-containing protein n=1 Tax=Rhizophagus irregularis (strain DAOM 197198w) TaxID=1432141 RepID=A0A015ICD9_RHIIW|nr:hypothetical protein RirG_261300 [Rhizophagus irregularis DAOM 197198w]UZO15725.1 hypothetical protein OCT59_007141 [Rhizophagus irregularis]GBC32816.1 arrestin/PY protein 2 [Rhizophagus irregularis DAOM 181602=DAOM 197198]CAG8520579.1 14261_t:CDS:1 [Rhizophagus irregularis]
MDSPTSSTGSSSSGRFSLFRNGPKNNEYIKTNKNIYLSYAEGSNTFQHGQLGDNDTFLVGTIHLNYGKPCQIKSVYLHLKGIEKTSWQRSQARSKTIYSGENTLVDQTNKVWEAFDDSEEVTMLDIPFKVQLPYNLPDTISTEFGSVQYVLRATVNAKALIGSSQQSVKLYCPLKRTITLDIQHLPPFKLCGTTPSGIDYTFLLPPNKCFNVGSYVSIPMKLRFLHPNVGVERVEVCLRTSMDYQSTTQGESKHVDQNILGIIVSRSELLFTQPASTYYGECTYTLNIFIPKNAQPTHQGRFMSIGHFININFYLWGFESDYHVEESVRIGNMIEKHPPQNQNQNQSPHIQQIQQPLNSINLSNIPIGTYPNSTPTYSTSSSHSYNTNSSTQSYTAPSPNTPITPQVTPPLTHRLLPTPPPSNQFNIQYTYMNDGGHLPVDTSYYQYNNNNQQQKPQLPQKSHERKPLPEQPKISYNDKPYDGYNQHPILNYNNITMMTYYNRSPESRRDSGTSTPLKEFETISNSSQLDILNGHVPYPTHLSPPPYRQSTRQQDYK